MRSTNESKYAGARLHDALRSLRISEGHGDVMQHRAATSLHSEDSVGLRKASARQYAPLLRYFVQDCAQPHAPPYGGSFPVEGWTRSPRCWPARTRDRPDLGQQVRPALHGKDRRRSFGYGEEVSSSQMLRVVQLEDRNASERRRIQGRSCACAVNGPRS